MVHERFPTTGQGFHRIPVTNPDEILAETGSAVKIPGGVIIAPGNTREVRIGELLARLSDDETGLGSEGQYIPRKSTELAAQVADNVTEITVDDAHPFAVGDTLVVQDSTGGGVITAIDYDTNTITMTAISGGTNPHPINSRVYVNSKAMGTAVGIAGERYTPNANLLNGVTDAGQSNMFGRVSMYIEGLFKKSKLKGSAAGVDTKAATDLNAADVVAAEGTLVRIRK